AGVETVGFADSNDPALFVGEAEGKIAVTVPLDDNVLPRYYAPLTSFLIARIARSL
ncbi:phosphatase, partial [Microbispora triticiradicis]|uniref:phosphatase n=1 Tax=Microbispora triticiradicis TaxID=2200763 RepID=UPI001AD74018